MRRKGGAPTRMLAHVFRKQQSLLQPPQAWPEVCFYSEMSTNVWNHQVKARGGGRLACLLTADPL